MYTPSWSVHSVRVRVSTLNAAEGGEWLSLSFRGPGFAARLRYMKQFAHSWHLPRCQCTETCSCVCFIQNDTYWTAMEVVTIHFFSIYLLILSTSSLPVLYFLYYSIQSKTCSEPDLNFLFVISDPLRTFFFK